jgi:formate hydrogenlyase transcriptional activator
VFPLELPPLRERPEDLPELTTRLVAELAAKLGRAPPRVPARTLSRLLAHDWPGNVRELRNTIERALILGPGPELELGDWGPGPPRTGGAGGLADALRTTIERALRASRGRIYGAGGAAERLGLPPSTLQSKLRSLGIDRRQFTS